MEVDLPRGLPTVIAILILAGVIGVWGWMAGVRTGVAEPTGATGSIGSTGKSGTDGVLRVMTANVRYSNPNDGENAWANRRELLVKTMLKHDPDVIGCQELTPVQGAYVSKELGKWYEHYPRAGVGRIEGEGKGGTGELLGVVSESFAGLVTVYYKAERFELVDGEAGMVLPERPQVVAGENTFYSLSVLKERGSGQSSAASGQKGEWIVVDTHLRFQQELAVACAERLRGKIAGAMKKFPGARVIVMGDMNHDLHSPIYKMLAHGRAGSEDGVGELVDGFDYSKQKEAWGTYHGFMGSARAMWPTDLIFAGGGLTWEGMEIVRDGGEKGVWPSDHFLVVGTVK